jgi:hypothetical protein
MGKMSDEAITQEEALASLSELLTEAAPYLVGVWRYHERGGPQQWCASVHLGDELFDLPPAPTMRGVLQNVVDEIRRSPDEPGITSQPGRFPPPVRRILGLPPRSPGTPRGPMRP